LFDPADAGAISSNNVSFIQAGSGAVTRTAQAKMRDVVSVKDFGAVGDGTTDDTTAVLNALASLTSGGALYFPAGTYKFLRGTGALIADTIPTNNVTVYGDGADSIISGFNGAGSIPNNAGNEYYNVFQATGRSGITVRDLAFQGYTTPISLFNCTDVIVDSIHHNGQLANAGGFMWNKSIYLSGCERVRITNSHFLNFDFAVYVGETALPTKTCIVSNCNFEHTTAAGSYTTLFPVGVYWYYSQDCVVDSCTFKNIYSSVDNGTSGTGMGYGVYEGDGVSGAGVISNNAFHFEAKGSKNATGIYTNEMQQCVISGNTFEIPSGSRLSPSIRLDSKTQDTIYTVSGNTINCQSTATSMFGVYIQDGFSAGSSTRSPKISITGNTIRGCLNAIRQDFFGNAKLHISGNTISGTTDASIQLSGSTTIPLKHPSIVANNITGSAKSAILFNQYIVSPSVIGNTLLDGNTSNTAGDLGGAVVFTSNSFGCFIAHNTIGNTAYGGGKFTFGVTNAASASNQIFKNILQNNVYLGVGVNNNRYYNNAAPANGLFDLIRNDYFENNFFNAGGVPGWYCVFTASPTLSADASNASTTVTVSSTSNFAAGDLVLLCKDSNPYDSDYYTSTQWHIDTIASVTDATNFVLTTGIPAGDGTYVAGTAFVKVARFKAAAAVAV
jgi:hypothetical protein